MEHHASLFARFSHLAEITYSLRPSTTVNATILQLFPLRLVISGLRPDLKDDARLVLSLGAHLVARRCAKWAQLGVLASSR